MGIGAAALAREPDGGGQVDASAPAQPRTTWPAAAVPSASPRPTDTTAAVNETPRVLLTTSAAGQAESTSPTPPAAGEATVIGLSAEGRPIEAYWFGQGERWVALVGGIHGGYEWNTALLAYELIDEFTSTPQLIPPGYRVAIIPAANPDGLARAVGHGGRFDGREVCLAGWSKRLNANGVDLNRNWDCEWQPVGQWRNQEVSAGDAPFSEPETQVVRDFLTRTPAAAAVVFWHSTAGATLAGACGKPAGAAETLAKAYADSGGVYIPAGVQRLPCQWSGGGLAGCAGYSGG